MSARKQKSEVKMAPGTGSAVSREQIERRAYEIFMGRSGESGDATADWLQAEQELLEETRHSSARSSAPPPRKETPRRPTPRSGA